MLKKITISLIILSIFQGCKAPEFKPQVRRLWSDQFQTCFCQNYDINKASNLDDFVPCDLFFDSEEPNRSFCDDLIGFNVASWAKEITPKAREVIRWAKDSCK